MSPKLDKHRNVLGALRRAISLLSIAGYVLASACVPSLRIELRLHAQVDRSWGESQQGWERAISLRLQIARALSASLPGRVILPRRRQPERWPCASVALCAWEQREARAWR